MKLPIQITFHNMPHDEAIESEIRAHVEWLDQYYDRIMSCRIVVDRPHRHHKEGNIYHVRIDLKLPGAELVVKREPSEHTDYKSLEIMIRDAFDEARRQLEDHVRQQRGQVKSHEPMPHARVGRLFRDAGYGFLETSDGREIYFHRNSVLDAPFESLEAGTEVRFVEELGDKGPQASAVRPVGRHGHL
jgi:cold shock CspA family protein